MNANDNQPPADVNRPDPPVPVRRADVATTLRSRPVPPTLSPTPNLAGLLIGLRRRWLLAAVLGLLLGGLAAFAGWYIVPSDKYLVEAKVKLALHRHKILDLGQPDTGVTSPEFQKTQIALVKSQVVLEAVLNDPKVANLPTVLEQESPNEWLRQKLEIDFKEGAEILRIGLRGDRAEDLNVLVNTVMKCYLDEFVNTEERQRKNHLAHLQRILEEHRKGLEQKRTKLLEFHQRAVRNPRAEGGLQDNQLKQMQDANERLQSIRDDIGRLELKLTELQGRLKADPELLVTHVAVEREANQVPVVMELRKQVGLLEAKEAEILSRPNITLALKEKLLADAGIRESLVAGRQSLDVHLMKSREEVRKHLRSDAVADLTAQVARAQHELAFHQEQRRKATEELNRLAANLKDIGKEAFEMDLLAKAVEQDEKLVAAVGNDIFKLDLERWAEPRAKTLDNAVVVGLSAGKKKMMLAGGAGFGTFAVVLLAIGWLEFRKRKLDSADELTHGFGLELVGTLPTMPGQVRRRLAGDGIPTAYARWTEAVDSYRMLLLRVATQQNVRVLMVTSATPGEGKTSLASHLAVSIARSGRTTLLIDSDMRKPTLHRLFGLSLGPGLGEVVRGEADLHDAIRHVPQAGLWVLTAGQLTPATIDAMCRDEMRGVFARLRKEFEVIVVDSCPVLPLADSLTVAQYVDGVVFSLMRGVSRLPKLAAALHRVKQVGAPVLGAVINRSDEDVYCSEYCVSVPAEDN